MPKRAPVTRRRPPKKKGTSDRRHGLVVDSATSQRFSKFPQRDTSTELVVRRALHAAGLRFRVHNRDLPGSPDIANRSAKWAVFVHGCFWHHHENCRRATIPKRNRAFWLKKFAANRSRDAAKARRLRLLGYQVFQIWECVANDDSCLRSTIANVKTKSATHQGQSETRPRRRS